MKKTSLRHSLHTMVALLLALLATPLQAQELTGHEYVDLGLPSGTKWATMNLGALSPEQTGLLFAWGETQTKASYQWGNLKYRTGGNSEGNVTFSRYVSSAQYGHVDQWVELRGEDDAARACWGGTWRLPYKEEVDELRDARYCTWTWGTLHGVKGYQVVSRRNGKSIFIPAPDTDSQPCYWSSSLVTGNNADAHSILLSPTGVKATRSPRFEGHLVRPVTKAVCPFCGQMVLVCPYDGEHPE